MSTTLIRANKCVRSIALARDHLSTAIQCIKKWDAFCSQLALHLLIIMSKDVNISEFWNRFLLLLFPSVFMCLFLLQSYYQINFEEQRPKPLAYIATCTAVNWWGTARLGNTKRKRLRKHRQFYSVWKIHHKKIFPNELFENIQKNSANYSFSCRKLT